MSDALTTLNELFVNYGAEIKPGDHLDWRTFDIPAAHEASVVDFIKEHVDYINQNRGIEKSNDISPFCNPIIKIFHKMDFVLKYMAGEFEVWTKNKKFREDIAVIWPELIRGWYFSKVYVAYGTDFEEIDRQKFQKDGKSHYLDGVPGKFRLFTQNSKGRFFSVFSQQKSLSFSNEQLARMTKFDCNGMQNWLYWWHIWVDWLLGMERFKESVKCLSKNVIMTPKSEAEFKNIRNQFQNNECFIKRNTQQETGNEDSGAMGKTKFEEMIFMPRETPMAILEGVQRYFELNAAHLGYAGRLAEQKKERINAGENFPHQKVVSNVRTYLINSLNLCFDQMRTKLKRAFPGEEIIPEDLKIIPANQAFAQGLPQQPMGGTFNNNQPSFGFNNGFNKFNKFNSWNNNRFKDFGGND